MFASNTLLSSLKSLKSSFIKHNKNKSLKAGAVKEKKKYTNTIILPKTKFPLHVSGPHRIQLDEFFIKELGFASLYNWQREHVKGPEFVLHDGPPYANGIPHMGHAINKILKDITIRNKLIQGHRIHYKPGWDCHGLPIELKAMAGHDVASLSPLTIRKQARKFAKEAIKDQKAVFKSWGVMADWGDGCYHTFDKGYVKNQLKQFYKLYEQDLVYRDVKPVFWSPSSRTALAEAELKYNKCHKSTTVIVSMRITDCPLTWGDDVHALIWTTTPWTLPANQAIAYNPSLSYCLVTLGTSRNYIVASDLVDQLANILNRTVNIVGQVNAAELTGLQYNHPLAPDHPLPLLASNHVTATKGTGMVHVAPAHGQDDFKLAKKYDMALKCLVNEEGCYTEDAGPQLQGLPVLTTGNEKVVQLCEQLGVLLHVDTFTHSYPYDWRTDLPVILRASNQWFFDTARIKSLAIEALEKVAVLPEKGMCGLLAQVQSRPFWCISRQRVWGVPIPVMYSHDDQPLISRELVSHYCKLLDTKGDDFWWSCNMSELAPQHLLAPFNLDQHTITKGQDILDIWLDSGLSWSAVLDPPVADLYLEGVDQFNGWFQSSLLTALALQKSPPYKTVYVHGFAVDEHGLKMSKSLGNVINPQDIVYGGQDLKKQPAYGVDTLRWWVAAHATHQKIVPVSESTLTDSKDCVHKLRSVLRFLLGALNTTDAKTFTTDPPALRHLDLYMLHSLHSLESQVLSLYNNYQYNKVCQTLINFVSNQVSGFYCHITKDRLYCEGEGSQGRNAVLSTHYHTLTTISHLIAPVLPILAEEVYSHCPIKDKVSLFHSQGMQTQTQWYNPSVESIVQQALAVKQQVTKLTPLNCSHWQLAVVVSAPSPIRIQLEALLRTEESSDSELSEILQVSHVVLGENSDSGVRVAVDMVKTSECERCRRYTASVPGQICYRCQTVLSNYY